MTVACGNGVLVPRIQPVRAGHPLRSLRSASPSLREGEGTRRDLFFLWVPACAGMTVACGNDGRDLVGFPVPDLVGEGEGLGLAAGVDEDDRDGRV